MRFNSSTARRMWLAVLCLCAFAVALNTSPPRAVTQQSATRQTSAPTKPGLRWYKGNTHTHTLNSDGDSTPDEVVRWYREHGYNFLVLTDHNFLTQVDGLNALHGADGQFLVIKGEEVTDRYGEKALHINGLNVERLVEPQGGSSVVEVLQRNVDAIRGARGVPHINHPNFTWAMTVEDLKRVRDDKLFEIYNGHPHVNNLGGGGHPGLEEMWDQILTSGKLLYGIAVDDAHHFKRPWDRTAALPGRGWVMVRAEALTPAAILGALEGGDFYASTGVELADYQTDGEERHGQGQGRRVEQVSNTVHRQRRARSEGISYPIRDLSDYRRRDVRAG